MCLITTLNSIKLKLIYFKIKLNSLSDDFFIIYPFNENDLCNIFEKKFYLKEIQNQNFKFQTKTNCKKIKFSFFINHGILSDNSFNFINIKNNTHIFSKIIINDNFVNFEFCPKISKGFEIFYYFFLK